MPPLDREQVDAFCNELRGFFEAIGQLGSDEAARLGEPYRRHLVPVLRDVVESLRGRDAGNEIREAIFRASDDRHLILAHIEGEVAFFVALVGQGGGEDGAENAAALGAAKTIKDSLEKWLGAFLPVWVKRLLEVLNELLSLLKGG